MIRLLQIFIQHTITELYVLNKNIVSKNITKAHVKAEWRSGSVLGP